MEVGKTSQIVAIRDSSQLEILLQPFTNGNLCKYPNGQFGVFVKACLRSVASGLGVSYNSLSGDLEGVNYSSIRAGLLEEREELKGVQRFVIEHVVDPIFREGLSYALLSEGLDLPAAKLDKFEMVEWKPRRWQWVDPLKDTQANVMSVANGGWWSAVRDSCSSLTRAGIITAMCLAIFPRRRSRSTNRSRRSSAISSSAGCWTKR